MLCRKHTGARVLLVEDNPVNREVALEVLQRVGLLVDTAENGRIALEKVQANDYNIVLMDMQMPVMDGLTATRAIRAQPAYAPLPILAMTANAFDENRRECLAAGMNDFVAKPVIPADLYATLMRWLSRSSQNELATGVDVFVDETPSAATLATTSHIAVDGLELAIGLRAVQGDVARYGHLLRLFGATHGEDMQAVMRHLDAHDTQAAQQLTHALKSAAATLGAIRLSELVDQLDAGIAPRRPRRQRHGAGPPV